MKSILTKQHLIKYAASIVVLCILRGIMAGVTHMGYFDPMFWLALVGLIGIEIRIDYKDSRSKTR